MRCCSIKRLNWRSKRLFLVVISAAASTRREFPLLTLMMASTGSEMSMK